jgi:hypothetical protein
MRDELLNETLFSDLDDARANIAASGANFTAMVDRLRNPGQICQSSAIHLGQPA